MKVNYEKIYPLAYKYNGLLKRFDKGDRYFRDKTIPKVEQEKHIDAFSDLIKEMGNVNKQIIDLGHKITDVEAFEGYNLIELSKKIEVLKYGEQMDLK